MLNKSKDSTKVATIAFYLGGVGCNIGAKLYRMTQMQGDDNNHLEVILIDSDAHPKNTPQTLYPRQQHYYYRNLSEVTSGSFHAFGKERLPINLGRNPLNDTSKGCGVTRAFAMASLALNRKRVEEMLAEAYDRIHLNRDANHTASMRVFVTASACGGTGAGMVVDLMAIVRAWFIRNGDADPSISLFLIAPDVLTKDTKVKQNEQGRRRMVASSYALLKELNGFASGIPFETYYHSTDPRVSLDTHEPSEWLFDWVYLFNRKNIDSTRVHDQESLSWLIAECQCHFTTGVIASRLNAISPNIREQRSQLYPVEYQVDSVKSQDENEARSLVRNSQPSFVASFSIASVRFPVEEIQKLYHLHWSWCTCEFLLYGIDIFYSEKVRSGLRNSSRLLIRRYDDYMNSNVERSNDTLFFVAKEVENSFDNVISLRKIIMNISREFVSADGFDKLDIHIMSTDESLSELKFYLNKIQKLYLHLSENSLEKDGWLLARIQDEYTSKVSSSVAGVLADNLYSNSLDKNSGWGLISLRDALRVLVSQYQKDVINHNHTMNLDGLGSAITSASKLLSQLDDDLSDETTLDFIDSITQKITQLKSILDGDEQDKDDAFESIELLHKRIGGAYKTINNEVADFIESRVFRAICAIKIDTLKLLAAKIDFAAKRIHLCIENREDEISSHVSRLDFKWGNDSYGLWSSSTVHNVGTDTSTLHSLQKNRLASEQEIVEGIVGKLNDTGLMSSDGNVTVANIEQFSANTIISAIDRSLRSNIGIQEQLGALNSGWLLPELAHLMHKEVPFLLDEGSAPLISVSPASLQPKIDAWMIAPELLQIPQPFMSRLGNVSRFPSVGNDTITIVQAMFGIPLASCKDIDDWFYIYLKMLGDLTPANKIMDESRFPLHVFSDGATRFPEIYQPINLAGVTNSFDCDLILLAYEQSIIILEDNVFVGGEFPFELQKDTVYKLAADSEIADSEWIAIRRFRLAICETIRRRAKLFAEFRKKIDVLLTNEPSLHPLYELVMCG